ncbi:hypothetical protein ACJMK2_021451 [Sinanodonta woodiana]|uniref:Uncharacterized protein n=1 Tax=Sinanodonta woodiana TaxID=1069815 RepID=A0ABD3TH98_SINWO
MLADKTSERADTGRKNRMAHVKVGVYETKPLYPDSSPSQIEDERTDRKDCPLSPGSFSSDLDLSLEKSGADSDIEYENHSNKSQYCRSPSPKLKAYGCCMAVWNTARPSSIRLPSRSRCRIVPYSFPNPASLPYHSVGLTSGLNSSGTSAFTPFTSHGPHRTRLEFLQSMANPLQRSSAALNVSMPSEASSIGCGLNLSQRLPWTEVSSSIHGLSSIKSCPCGVPSCSMGSSHPGFPIIPGFIPINLGLHPASVLQKAEVKQS